MAFHNTNWTAVPLTIGTYTLNELGDGLSGSSVHEIFCTSGGTITITAAGGGEFTWTATSGQKVNVVTSKIVVNDGIFVGFKINYQSNR